MNAIDAKNSTLNRDTIATVAYARKRSISSKIAVAVRVLCATGYLFVSRAGDRAYDFAGTLYAGGSERAVGLHGKLSW